MQSNKMRETGLPVPSTVPGTQDLGDEYVLKNE